MTKRVVRQGVFETNSSSVHSLTVCDKAEYDRWVAGEMILDTSTDKLVDVKDVDPNKAYRYETHDEYSETAANYEEFEEVHTTKSGDQIVIFGYHGDNH